MATHRRLKIQFPLAGLNRAAAYRQQPPFSSTDLLNVRPRDVIEERQRGGSRPGLVESHTDDLGGEVRLLAPMRLNLADNFTAWSDTFSGSSMAAAWTQASWSSNQPSILPSALASVDYSTSEAASVRDALPIDTSEVYAVEVYLAPWNGAWHGKYQLFLRLDNASPDIETDGVAVELVQAGTTGDYTASLVSYDSGSDTSIDTADDTLSAVRAGWLTAVVDGNDVTVYWNGTEILAGTVDAHAGSRVGFGLECTVDGGLCLVNTFRAQYYSTGSVTDLRSMLVASADGDLYRETRYGRMEAVSTSLTLADAPLQAAQHGQKLYIADYSTAKAKGTDGTVSGTSLDAASYADWTAHGIDADDDVVVISNVTGATTAGTYAISSVAAGAITLASAPGDGTCSYRIERAPKVYDPLAGTLSIVAATDGQTPSGCPIIFRHIDRIFLAGAEIAPHVWYCSRQGDPLDWDYSQTDSQRAVAGTSSEAGVPGDPITAGLSHSDDYAILACRNSLWRLRGDPAYGGSLDALSHTVGIVGKNAWCFGPTGELIFLSLDGIHVLAPGGNSFPISMSHEVLPREFQNLDPTLHTVSLEYDVQGRGVHIYLTPESSNARVHWWFDWEDKTYWPMSLQSDHEPTTTCQYQATAIEDSGVILGGRDGKLRRFSGLADNDCGSSYSTYAVLGPIALAGDGRVGGIISIDAVMATGSGDVTWSIHTAQTFEGVASASASDSGTWSAGLNATNRPACRGQAFSLKITGTAGRRWAFESATAVIKEAGRRRLA